MTRLRCGPRHNAPRAGQAPLADYDFQTLFRLADSVGIRALLVHARDDAARHFSMAQAEFQESPSDPLHLLLPVKDIIRSLS